MKYPETPRFHATVDRDTKELTSAQIDYNGVRVEVKTVPSQLDLPFDWDSGLLHSVDFKSLEQIVGGKPKVTDFEDPYNELGEDLLDIRKINLRNADALRYVTSKITKYATWFNAEQKKKLEGLLKRCTTYKSIAADEEAAKSEPYHPDSFQPRRTYRPTGVFIKE